MGERGNPSSSSVDRCCRLPIAACSSLYKPPKIEIISFRKIFEYIKIPSTAEMRGGCCRQRALLSAVSAGNWSRLVSRQRQKQSLGRR